jgi:hypothetical protein
MARSRAAADADPVRLLLAPVSLARFLWGDVWFQRYMALFRCTEAPEATMSPRRVARTRARARG